MRITAPLAFFLIVASTLSSQTISTFDVPNSIETTPIGITPSGTIVGYYWDTATNNLRVFLRARDGAFTLFVPPGAIAAYPTGINAAGDIVGIYAASTTEYYGFLRNRAGTFTSLNFFPTAISPSGEIVGYNGEHGVLRRKDGSTTTIDVPGALGTRPDAIDSKGEVTGYYNVLEFYYEGHGFVRDADGNITTFIVDDQNYDTYPTAIGPQGQVVGYATNDFFVPVEGFLREPDGNITQFEATRGYNGLPADQTFPTAINSSGLIVGYGVDIQYPSDIYNGFLRSPDGTLILFTVPGAASIIPSAISPRGEITGYYTDSNGHTHGFIRMP